jgi:hypothetical protein
MLFRLITHRANDGTGHESLQGKLYLTMATRGKARVLQMHRVAYSAVHRRRCGVFYCHRHCFAAVVCASLTRFGVHASIDFLP